MKNIYIKILTTLLLFNLVYNKLNLKSQNTIESIEEKALEFDFHKSTKFNTNTNKYFKFKYEKNELLTVLIYIKKKGDMVKITDSNGNFVDYSYYEEYEYSNERHLFSFNITNQGTYLLEFYNKDSENPFAVDNEFTVLLPGQVIDTIDFSQKMYYNYIDFRTNFKFKPFKYIVKNLKKDIYVYFLKGDYFMDIEDSGDFVIDICHDNICDYLNYNVYLFSKEKEYTINIYFTDYGDYYYIFPYLFFPIEENTIETIDKGFYKSTEPKFYVFEMKERYSLKLLQLNCKYFYICYSDQELNQNNLNRLYRYKFGSIPEIFQFYHEDFKYITFLVIPPVTQNEFMDNATRLAIVDEIIDNINDKSITIPKGNTTVIYLDNFRCFYEYGDNYNGQYNLLRTYSSTEKNMQYVMSNNSENFDFLIENCYENPIYIKESNKDVKIEIEVFYPKYSFFGVMNKELFKSYLSFLLRSSYKEDKSHNAIPPIEPKRFVPINIRAYSDLNRFYEFFNFYFKDFEENVNIYINKIYGGTEFYECNEDSINIKQLSKLTTPISTCNNKKSVFNRLFSLKGSKLIMGYLSPNSYFDIYVEYNEDENDIIKIPSVSENTANSASKYIRKNIDYKIDFIVDHMVKIESEKNIEVIIYNSEESIKLNSDSSTAHIEGKNYFVRTNIDTMIYFFGRLNSYIKQIKIDPIQKGKNIKITANKKCELYYCLDIGFEGFNPLNSAILINKLYELELDPNSRPLFIENIYEKIEKKLAKNENLYLYFGNKNVNDIRFKIEYINENINHPNNDYNFNVIPKNSQNKCLVINNFRKRKILFGVYICGNSPAKIYYINDNKEEYSYSFSSNNDMFREETTHFYGIKFRFESSEDFIFLYSYYDKTDMYTNFTWIEERQILNELNITDITENSKDNIISFFSKLIIDIQQLDI